MTFSTTVSVGSSWKNWNTTPMVLPRHIGELVLVESAWTGVPSITTVPDVGRSMPVIMLMSVVLPLPDLPISPMNSPAPTLRLMPRSAVNGTSPES